MSVVTYVLYRDAWNWFYAELQTPPGEQVDFVLSYQQLLRRQRGVYRLTLPLRNHLRFHLCLNLLAYTM